MKVRVVVAMFSCVFMAAGICAGAESLADAAKRERERRKKNQEAGVTARTVRPDEVKSVDPRPTATPRSDSSGEPPDSSGSSMGRDGMVPGGTVLEPPERRSAPSAVDGVRNATLQALRAKYQKIAGLASSLDRNVESYEKRCEGVGGAGSYCANLFDTIVKQAVIISIAIDESEDEARKGWLPAGEVRDLRRQTGLDDAIWDELVRIVSQYRR